MAASRKTQTKSGKRSNSKKKTSQTKANKKTKDTAKSGIGLEIGLTLLLAVSILIGLGNVGLCGAVGDRWSDALFGIFGLAEYIFPFLLFFGAAFYLANRRNPEIGQKMAGLCLMLIFLCAFLELLTQGYSSGKKMVQYFRVSSVRHTGGGLLGGGIVKLFGGAFGLIGAYILVFAGLIIAAIVLTQKPLWRTIRHKSEGARERARAVSLARREEAEKTTASKEEKKTSRGQKKASRDGEKEPVSAREAFAAQASDDTVRADMSILRINGEPLDGGRRANAPSPANQEAPVKEEKKEGGFHIPSFLHSDAQGRDSSKEEPDRAPVKEEAQAMKSVPREAQLQEEDVRKEEARSEDPKKEKRQSPKEQAKQVEKIALEISDGKKETAGYRLPPLSLMTKGQGEKQDSRQYLMQTAEKLETTLRNFGVNVHVVNVSCGPTVTRYELAPEQGVKVSRIVSLQDDIKLNLAASEIRIEAPIPGKAAVGIEVPNKETSVVMLRDLLESQEFQKSRARLAFAVGKDIGGRPVVTDIEKMPHLLIAGATGSGKSVCINTLIVSLLVKYRPDEVKMLMIDPKVVELKIYDGIPHLLIPVVTDAKKAAGALNWAVQEMTKRYQLFSAYPGIRDIKSFNKMVESMKTKGEADQPIPEKMPRIVIIVDELADLMMVASSEVEDAICRLAQLARAAGIHLIIATQRPSVNVVTGLIKANMPSRIALAVTSGVDSRTILDMNGAEKLLGKGDMLFYPQGYPKPARVQGAFVSDEDINALVKFLTSQGTDEEYNKEVEEEIVNTIAMNPVASSSGGEERDEYFADAGRLIIDKDKASIGMLQRAFKIGFNRAARIMDQLADAGVVGPEEGTKPRRILLKNEEFEELLKTLS